ncbi:MAG: RNA polymerase sigma factor [Deltaproteobacteria bacterium]|nr:RNA polymerase sigma factor [Deltaproteobacteria bacterium]MBW2691077.1 RNA polymerase sigma factor [Deltaproteobacteria bacterium]
MEDAPLIARVVADDDRHAFATLVRKHQGAVRAFLLRLSCGDRALADDVAQETFLRAYQRIGTYRSEGGFHSWLFAIAYRVFASEKRKRHWSAEELKEVPEVDQSRVSTPDTASEDIARAMRHLREPERACISLCYQSGMSHREVANTLGYPVGTVKTHIGRGKEKLREHLSAYGPQQEVSG